MSKPSLLRRRPLVRIITAATVVFCSFIWNSLRIQNRPGGADSEPGSDEGSKNRMNRRAGETAGFIPLATPEISKPAHGSLRGPTLHARDGVAMHGGQPAACAKSAMDVIFTRRCSSET